MPGCDIQGERGLSMKTKYQQVLEALSSLNKTKKKGNSKDTAELFFDFIAEVEKDVKSGIEIRQVAAIQKLKNIKEIIDQMKQEEFVELDSEKFPEDLKEIQKGLKSRFEEKISSVIKAIDEYMR